MLPVLLLWLKLDLRLNGLMLHHRQIVVHLCPRIARQLVDQRIDRGPIQADGDGPTHAGVSPLCAHAPEDVEGRFVVRPDFDGFSLEILKLKTTDAGFGLGNLRLVQCAGDAPQFPKRP